MGRKSFGDGAVIVICRHRGMILAAAMNGDGKPKARDARTGCVVCVKTTGLAVELASGGKTKYNRIRLHVPKTHALDAACVGELGALHDWQKPCLAIKCTGRGSYQRTRLDKYGFPRGYLMRVKRVHGYQTGDLVSATVPSGKKAGSYTGRVAVRGTRQWQF